MKLTEDKSVQILRQIMELEPIEFLGICKILGVSAVTVETVFESTESTAEGGPANGKVELTPRPFEDIWDDVCNKVDSLNRTQKRNLQKLVKAATKQEK